MIQTVATPLIAFLVVVTATPVFARLAPRLGLVVEPRTDRWHTRSTPLLGGAAVTLAVTIAMLVGLGPGDQTLRAVLIPGLLAFALGLVDDFRRMSPASKLAGQMIVAGVLVLGGVQVEIVEFAPAAFVLTVFWVVGIMNAVNLLDNMDGLAAGVTAIAATVLGITAAAGSAAESLAFATAGAAAGFLIFNFSPARVFMGDAGSQFLGFLLAAVGLLQTASGAANAILAVLAPVLALALPIFETAFVTASRRLAGRPIGQGGRDHTSHRLAALGLSDRSTVFLLYGVAALLAAVGLIAESVSALLPPLLVLAVIGLALFGVFLAEIDVYDDTARGRSRPDDAVARAFTTYGRFGAEVGMDLMLLTTAYYVSYLIRFEQDQSSWLPVFVNSLPFVVGAQLGSLVAHRTYRSLWRYLTVHDAFVVARAIAIGTAAATLAILLLFRFEGFSRAVFVLDALIAFTFFMGSRAFLAWLRHWSVSRPRSQERRVVIVGANDSGALAAKLLMRAEVPHRAVGFVDDDIGKRYRRVGGVPVVGTTDQIEDVLVRLRPDLVLLAETAGSDAVRTLCEQRGIPWREFKVEI